MSRASGSEEKERVVYEFDGFRADPVRRVLYRHGEPVAITPKALSVLLILLERAGEVVEKKELIEKIWPGVFVSEANLTQNIFSLRKCLGERTGSRYVVTIPGQGYSFAGDVRRVERSSTSEISIVVDVPPPPEVPTGGEPSEAPPALPSPETRSGLPAWKKGLAALLVSLAIGAALFGILRIARRSAPATGFGSSRVRPAIAVLDFRSLSPGGETRWLETALAEMLTTELAPRETRCGSFAGRPSRRPGGRWGRAIPAASVRPS